jgi:hypothetical protein
LWYSKKPKEPALMFLSKPILYTVLRAISFVFFFHAAKFSLIAQHPIINEFVSSNSNGLQDEDGDYSDWIEVYNPHDETIQLNTYFLSDKENDIFQWKFPDITLEPKEFLLVYASGKNRTSFKNSLHTNFSIKAEGETLFLSTNDTVFQSIPPIALQSNYSYGMEIDGNLKWVIFPIPTPGQPNTGTTYGEEIFFSKESGIYKQKDSLSLILKDSSYRIFYTTDGSVPNINSKLYNRVLYLNEELFSNKNISKIQQSDIRYFNNLPEEDILKTIVIRAAAFDTNGIKRSQTYTNTYIIEELGNSHEGFKIISLCIDSASLFDFDSGILVPGVHFNNSDPDWSGNYFQKGRSWEKNMHLEVLDNNSIFKSNGGIRIHGGASRRFSQKSLRLYARNEYGSSHFEHKFFSEREHERFKRLVIKPFVSSWSDLGFENILANKLCEPLKTDRLASEMAVLYINGEYWGIYTLQESIDEHYLEQNFNVNPDSINIIESWYGSINTGDNKNFLDLYNFIENSDLTQEWAYNKVKEWIDIENFIDYQIYQIFIANYDWPGNNMKCWQEVGENKKWRWIFYDGDVTLLGLNNNSFEHALNDGPNDWPTGAKSTLFFRKLMENKTFEFQFFNRLTELLNSSFESKTTIPIQNLIANTYRAEIPNQQKRFQFPQSIDSWEEVLLRNTDFLEKRACVLKDIVMTKFQKELIINSCKTTSLKISNQELSIFPNPIEDKFSIQIEAIQSGNCEVLIYNQVGQKIYHKIEQTNLGENIFEINDLQLPLGVLYLKIITNNTFWDAKILKIK